MLARAILRIVRKLLLGYGRRMPPERMLALSRRGALAAIRRAARISPAYKTLLAECGQSAETLEGAVDLTAMPALSKANTFERFTLDQLAGCVVPADLADVLTSSGRGSGGFGFRLTNRRQHDRSWFDIDLGLQDAFDVDRSPTLLVNCLPMGVLFRSRAVTVANVSVREDMACSILRDVGGRFGQTIVCTDPLFIKPLLDHASAIGLDWRGLNTSLIMGEEILVEAQRDYIAGRMGIDLDSDTRRVIASSFGVGELGLNLLFESRETIRLRRAMRHRPELALLLAGSRAPASLPALFCFNPLRCHIEVLNPDRCGFGELCFTTLDRHAVIPLPRYVTGDLGRLIDPPLLTRACETAGLPKPWLPMLAVRGRVGDRITGLPSVEEIKEAIYAEPELADSLTGAFRLRTDANRGVQLLLQSNSGVWGPAPTLLSRFSDRMIGAARPVEVVIVAPSEFPFRPWVDYERKFRYIDEQI